MSRTLRLVAVMALLWGGPLRAGAENKESAGNALRRLGARVGISAQAFWPHLPPELKAAQKKYPFTLVVIGGEWKGGIEGLEHLKNTPGVRGVMFTHPDASDAWARVLRDMPGLKQVFLTGDKFTDAGMPHLAKLTDLESLSLVLTGVTDNGLRHLRNLRKVRWLSFALTFKLTDAGMAQLEGFAELRHLNLAHTYVTGKGVAHLKKATKLEWLQLSGEGLQTPGFKHLLRFENLAFLDVGQMSWTSRETKDARRLLKSLKKLKQINARELGDDATFTLGGWQMKERNISEEEIKRKLRERIRKNLDD